MRHKPPLQWREWILDPGSRQSRIGTPLPCPLCDRSELPEATRKVRQVDWDAASLPPGLRRAHRLGSATWGRLHVHHGSLRYRAATTPETDVEIGPGGTQTIPPGVQHEVQPSSDLQVALEFFTVDRPGPGGDPACWAGLVCPDCGGVEGDGTGHRPGCPAGPSGG